MATINGTNGPDTLDGTTEDDVITGGHGPDLISGWGGSDTYMFSLGWGHDTIDNWDPSDSIDAIVFDATVAASDIQLVRGDDDNLYLSHVNGQDTMRILGFFADPGYRIDEVRFADGTVWDIGGPVITSNGGGSTGSANVAENSTAVTTVTARDGGAVSFSIVGGADSSQFNIDAVSR